MRLKHITKNPAQTKRIGRILSGEILRNGLSKKAILICLKGDLGAGKTTFLQGFAKGLGIKERILSPTFVLMKRFRITKSKFKNFYHFDCYRIRKPKEILDLDFRKILSSPENIIAIEWAEKIRQALPQNAIWVKFEFIDKTKRSIMI